MDIGKPKIAIRGSKSPLDLALPALRTGAITLDFIGYSHPYGAQSEGDDICVKEQRVDGYSLCIRLKPRILFDK